MKECLEMTRYERTNWRDEWMSKWHRNKLTNSEPMHDIDCIEWRYGQPVAIIEWKYIGSFLTFNDDDFRNMWHNSRWTLERLSILADMLKLPVYILGYDRKGNFVLWSFNQRGLKHIAKMNEAECIDWHKRLRTVRT